MNKKTFQKNVNENVLDCIVIGSGIAGLSASIYLARGGIKKTLIFGKHFDSQLYKTTDVDNFPASGAKNGPSILEQLIEHAKTFLTSEHFVQELITDVQKHDNMFYVTSNTGITYVTKTVLLAMGSKPKKLFVPNEDSTGVSYCAVCDGFFFQNQDVVVVGGGNSAMESALMLEKIAKCVYIVNKNSYFKGETILLEKIEKSNKIKIFYNANTTSFNTDSNSTLNSINFLMDGIEHSIHVNGAFINIGMQVLHIENLKCMLHLNSADEIVINERCMTNIHGLFAAGDQTNIPFKQAVIASGHGATAALSIIEFLIKK